MTDRAVSASERTTLLGSLCSGVDGLALGIERAIGARTVWQAEIDPNASKVLAAHWSCPNLGDLTAVDWTAVAPVDVMCAGYPCQPFSHAGRRLGENDVRHLWPYVLDAVRVVRPQVVLLENVAGHLSLGFGRVLGDLAEVGYDCRWTCIRASDVGACHRRERVFIAATDADSIDRRGRRAAGRVPPSAGPGDQASVADTRRVGRTGRRGSGDVARAQGAGQGEGKQRDGDAVDDRRAATPDAGSIGWQRRTSIEGVDRDEAERGEAGALPSDVGRPFAADPHGLGCQGAVAESLGDDSGGHCVAWGDYEPAIRRHERAFGRRAPDPVDDRGRLSPHFVEWMMMFPEGHVTDHLGRTKALKALGNAVVPAVAERACRLLLTAEEIAA